MVTVTLLATLCDVYLSDSWLMNYISISVEVLSSSGRMACAGEGRDVNWPFKVCSQTRTHMSVLPYLF